MQFRCRDGLVTHVNTQCCWLGLPKGDRGSKWQVAGGTAWATAVHMVKHTHGHTARAPAGLHALVACIEFMFCRLDAR